MLAQGFCVADMAESLFETKIGRIVFWPIYVVVTTVITFGAALCGMVVSKIKKG